MKETGGFYHRAATGRVGHDRDGLVLEWARGRRVIHVGCTDSPYTESRLKEGTLLHSALLESCSQLMGVDIDTRGIEVLQSRVGGDYLVGNIADQAVADRLRREFTPELVLATDVIEHVGDVEAFLRGLAAAAGPSGSVVITTPNALAIRNSVFTLAGAEVIHPDHRQLYSPVSLKYSAERAGMKMEALWLYTTRSTGSKPRLVLDALVRGATRFRPSFADGLLMTLRVTG